jgi:DNA polymerase-3 subunit gamma/tau
MGQALYRKYRSKSLSEVVGQDHITKTLQNALKSGKISHAYLLTGPRGVGKTSVARILAHEVNGLPYKDEAIHLDIIEIDAASNRRIDEIRELRDKVNISPTSARYKVYIIDEVHMLTREAFNALLKTLEEPPAHCIFILATTEAHKLPDTIISRTQRFNFKPIDKKTASAHLRELARKEKISIEPEAIDTLATHGNGSFRDSISLLDQFGSNGQKITEEMVRAMLGLPSGAAVESLIASVESGDNKKILVSLDELSSQSANPAVVAKDISSKLRQKIMDGESSSWIYELLRNLLAVPTSEEPYETLEICLLEASTKNSKEEKDEIKIPPPKIPNSGKEESVKEKKHTTDENPKSSFELSMWPGIVSQVKKEAASLYTALRLAIPSFESDILTLIFQFPLHQKKVNQIKHKDTITQEIERATGSKIRIECVVDKKAFESELKTDTVVEAKDEKTFTNQLQTISNIFGTAEVLES